MNDIAKSDAATGSTPTRDVPQHDTIAMVLSDEPLHARCLVTRLFINSVAGWMHIPDQIDIHCDNEKCGGVRRHTFESKEDFRVGNVFYTYLRYLCTNCTASTKIFGIRSERQGNRAFGICTKIYQEPPFGAPIPKRLFEVIGEDNREFFLQARRAIARGLGIGAYAYYRRIVENNKFDLVNAVLHVAEASNTSAEQIKTLKQAAKERQFSKAIELLRDASAIPAVLLIDGHNPLALLHDLLSEGIHELDDAECLERAKESEVILSEIAERMQIALTERKAVKHAISSILNRKSKTGSQATATKVMKVEQKEGPQTSTT
jgi:hypothetical protein